MKITKILFYVSALSLIITSCSKSTELSDAIPADAGYIVHFNNQSLIEKSKYDIFQNPTIQQGINVYKAFLKDQDVVKMLDEFMKDPNSLGLDLKKDLYFYTNYKTYGIVLGVNNADKLKNAILKFLPVKEEDIRKKGDIHSFSESMLTAAWDGSKFILLVDMTSAYMGRRQADSESVNTQELAVEQLKQGADKSINSVKSFAEFTKQRKDISVFYNMDGIENVFKMADPSGLPMDKLMPAQQMMAEFKGVSLGMYTSFEKGEIKATGEYYYDTPETEKRFKELVSGATGAIKGEHLKYVKEDPLFMMAVNMKGTGVYQYLERLGIVKLMEDEFPTEVSFTPEQVKELIENVDGDFTFVVSSIKESTIKVSQTDPYLDEVFEEEIATTIPQVMLFANISKPDYVLSFVKEQLDANKTEYKEIAPSVFLLDEGNLNVYLGINGNTFFATNVESAYNDLNASGLDNKYSDQIKGKIAFMTGDLQPLKSYLEDDRSMAQFVKILDELGKYQMTSSVDDFSADCKLEFKNKDENSLAVLCKQIDAMISNTRIPLGF